MRNKVGKVALLLVDEVVVNAENAVVEQLEEFGNPIFGPRRKIDFSGGHTARLKPMQSQIEIGVAHTGQDLNRVKH